MGTDRLYCIMGADPLQLDKKKSLIWLERSYDMRHCIV